MRKPKIVKTDKLRDRDSKFTYPDFRDKLPEDAVEPAQGNPDVLPESAGTSEYYKRGPNETRAMKLMDRAVDLLSDRQRQAYIGYYRENKTEQEIGDDLGITKQSVSKLLYRALTFIADFCQSNGSDLAADGGDDAR